MTDDLVERLRKGRENAADRIEALTTKVEQLAVTVEQLERELSVCRMAQVVRDNTVETLTDELRAARTILKEKL